MKFVQTEKEQIFDRGRYPNRFHGTRNCNLNIGDGSEYNTIECQTEAIIEKVDSIDASGKIREFRDYGI